VSNAGKTSLLVDPAINSYGEYNSGTISSSSNFFFKNLLDKELAIIDDSILHKDIANQLKTFGSNELTPVNIKYKIMVYTRLTDKIIISTNSSLFVNSLLSDIAIQNRIVLFKFNNSISLSKKDRNYLLKELPKILIYCNKFYFDKINSKSDSNITIKYTRLPLEIKNLILKDKAPNILLT